MATPTGAPPCTGGWCGVQPGPRCRVVEQGQPPRRRPLAPRCLRLMRRLMCRCPRGGSTPRVASLHGNPIPLWVELLLRVGFCGLLALRPGRGHPRLRCSLLLACPPASRRWCSLGSPCRRGAMRRTPPPPSCLLAKAPHAACRPAVTAAVAQVGSPVPALAPRACRCLVARGRLPNGPPSRRPSWPRSYGHTTIDAVLGGVGRGYPIIPIPVTGLPLSQPRI